MTAPEFPDVPDLLAQMRAHDDVDAPRPPNTLATIRELANRQTPEQRQAAREYGERVAFGLDALDLGETFLEQGNLDAAARWFAVAVRYDADGARAELETVEQLQAAFAEPGVPDDSVLGPAPLEQRPHDDAAARGISTYTLDWADREAERITTEARDEAAAIVQNAKSSAAALVLDAQTDAARIRAQAHRDAEMIRARAADDIQGHDERPGAKSGTTLWKLDFSEPADSQLWRARWCSQTGAAPADLRLALEFAEKALAIHAAETASLEKRFDQFMDATFSRGELVERRWFTGARSRLWDVARSLKLFVPSLPWPVGRDERPPIVWDGPRVISEQEHKSVVAEIHATLGRHEHRTTDTVPSMRDSNRDVTVVDMCGRSARLVFQAKFYGSPSALPVLPMSEDDGLIVITDLSAP
ncbi:ATP synthase F0 subunit B [Lentzea sp. NPDC102401]|uniref:ATP synthase F0 subunit B n=1 Tax=Lentzea sp. NPDC102401 TaxID=3364128 RepID=UPI003822F9B5